MLRIAADAQDGIRSSVIGRFHTVNGSVAIKRANGIVAHPVVGDIIYQGDRIETGIDGQAIILLVDGTAFQLDAGTHMVLDEFTCGAEGITDAALFRIVSGSFRFITGKIATTGRLIVDTPLGRIQSAGRAAGFGSLAFSVLTLGLIHELKAASADFALLDDETISYKDLKHGVFVIVTKENNPRVIVVDDPEVSLVLRPNGGAVNVQPVANNPTQMAQLQSVYDGVSATFSQGKQDPFIQQFQQGTTPNDHANAQPQSIGGTGSSTPPSELNSSPQLFQGNSGSQLVNNVGSNATSIISTVIEAVAITTNSQSTSALPFATVIESSTNPTTVDWVSTSSGNWDVGPNWNINSAPPAQDIVEINQPVTVTIDQPETVASLAIGAGATLNIVSGGSLTVTNGINNAGVIELNDPTLSINGAVTLSGGGVIEMLGPTTYNLIIGVPATGATLVNVNNTITGSGMIGQGDGNLALQNDAAGIINANVSGEPIVIDTGNLLINAGLIEATNGAMLTIDDRVANSGMLAANGGILDVVGAVSGSGSATISGGGTLELGGADAQTVTFADASTLKLDNPASFTGQIDGLAVGDILDLSGTAVTRALIEGSTLAVTESNGTQLSYQIAGALSGNYFAIQNDGASGDELVLSPAVVVSETAPATLAVNENTLIALTGANLISVSDAPNTADTLTTTLTVSHGTVTVATTDGVTGGSGASVTLTGTAAAIDAALATASYTGGTNYSGSDSLVVTTTDASSGSTATQTVAITIASGIEHWVGTSNADWSTVSASDWSFVSPPTSANPTVIDAGGTYTVTISSADVAQSLSINDAGATVLDEIGGSLTLGGVLTVDAGVFELSGGTLVGVSTLTIGASGVFDAANPTSAVIIDTGNPVVNQGTLEASNSGDLVIQDSLDNEGGTVSIQDGTVELAIANALIVNFSGLGGTLQLDSTVTGGAAAGVDATSTGTAAMTITGAGSVTSTGADGIEATAAGGDITITQDGSVTGASSGIEAVQDGGGNITIGVGPDVTIRGDTYYGVLAVTEGAGDLSLSTAANDVVDSTSTAIVAENQAGAINANSTIIVTTYGTIDAGTQTTTLGHAPDGIAAGYLPNESETTDLNVTGTVTVNNFANITALGEAGINAFNFGNGDVTVNDNYVANNGAGTVAATDVSGEVYGIDALALSGGTGDVSVNLGANATVATSTGSGGLFGIYALSEDTGNITVTMAAGDKITSGSAGILAVNEADSSDSTVTVTAAGTIDSGTNTENGGAPSAGIIAGFNPGDDETPNAGVVGNVFVTSDATINAVAGFGIWAFNFGTGDTSVTANSDSAITTSGTSSIDGFPTIGIGVYAYDGGNVSIDNAGSVSAPDGVALGALATGGSENGTVTITNSGNLSGVGSFTIDPSTGLADPVVGIITDGGAASLTNESGGTIAGPTAAGFAVANLGGGTLTINNYGTITGDVELTSADTFNNESGGVWNISGINTFGTGSALNNAGTINSSGTTEIDVTFNNTGTVDFAATVNIDSGTLDLTAGGADSLALYQGAGTLEFDATRSFDDVTLTGSGGTLTIDNDATLDFITAASAVNFANLTNESTTDSLQIEGVRVTFDDTTVSGGAITETGSDAQINVDAGNSATFENMILTLSNTTATGGSVLVAGTLTVESTVTVAGTGTFTIASGGTLDFGGAVGAPEMVDFAASSGMLQIGDVADFAAPISGFTGSDIIDLTNITYSSSGEHVVWDQSTGFLEVLNGNNTIEASLQLDGTYTTDNFSLASDFGTGAPGGTAGTEVLWTSGPTVDTWSGTGDWVYDTENWSTGAPPGPGEQAAIASGANPSINAETVILDDVTLQNGGEIDVGVASGATLTLENDSSITGGTIVLGSAYTSGTLDIEAGGAQDSTLDDVTVTMATYGAIEVGASTLGAVLTLDDGTTISGGTLTIGSSDNPGSVELDVELGSNGPNYGATLDGVAVTNFGSIEVDLNASGAILTLDDGTTISGGTFTIGSSNYPGVGELDVELGSNGPNYGATLDGVNVANYGAIDVDLNASGAILTLDDGTTIAGGTLTIGSFGALDIEAGASAEGATLDGATVYDNGAINVGQVNNDPILTLDDGTAIYGNGSGTLTINFGNTVDVEPGNGPSFGAALDGVYVYDYGTLDLGDVNSGAILTLTDGTYVYGDGGTLTINPSNTLEIEHGSADAGPYGATLDGVDVTDEGAITVDLASQPVAVLELNDSTTITGGGTGTLTIDSYGTLDIEYGSYGPGATLDGVNVTDNGAIDVALATGTIVTFELNDGTTINGDGTLNISSYGELLVDNNVNDLGATIENIDVTNNGTVEVNGATLDVAATASFGGTTGDVVITGGGTADFQNTLEPFEQNVTFGVGGQPGAGTLELAAAYSGTITNFGAGDVLDLTNLNYLDGPPTLSWTQNGSSGTLTVVDNGTTENFALEGTYTPNNFSLQPDSGTGTEVVFNTQNLVLNGGFETGDFTGWTEGGNEGFTGVENGFGPTGGYAAYIGPIGSNFDLAQTIQTVPGDTYQISFELSNLGGTPSDLSLEFGDTTLMSLLNTPGQSYTEYTFDVVATSSSTDLEFIARQDPTYWYLADVSVVQIAPVGSSVSWTNANGGSWGDGANPTAPWSTGAIPTSADDVTIAAASNTAYSVTIDNGVTAYADSLTVNNAEATVVDDGTLALTGELSVTAGNFDLAGGSLQTTSIAVANTGNFVGYGTVQGSVEVTGTIEAAAAASALDFSGAVTGTGSFSIDSGASLEFDSSVATGTTVYFGASTGTLIIGQPSSFDGAISASSGSLASGDVIYLEGFNATYTTATPTFNSSTDTTTLLVTDSNDSLSVSLILDGNYSADIFTASSASGGADIADPPAAATIVNGSSLDISTSSNETVTFTGATGSLVVSEPESFTGQIIGFTGTAPDPAHSDTIDLVGINYDSPHFSEAYNASTGLLTVGDGTNAASLTFVNFDGTFSFASDGNGGTLITDPPPAAAVAGGAPTDTYNESFTPEGSHYVGTFSPEPSNGNASLGFEFSLGNDQINFAPGQTVTQSYDVSITDLQNPAANVKQTISVSIGGPGNDNFIFHPGVGADTIVNFNAQADTIELDHFANVQSTQQLTSLITADAHGDAVIELGHNDSITIPGTTASYLQAHLQSLVHLH